MKSDEKNQGSLTDRISDTCKAIKAQIKGRSNSKEGEIIAIECEKYDISINLIRKIMEMPENRKKSTRYK